VNHAHDFFTEKYPSVTPLFLRALTLPRLRETRDRCIPASSKMYRNAAQNYGQIKCLAPNALPSPDNTSDSDCDLLDALEEKRRELDEEIARFKAAKDREFREFEKELRGKRRKSRNGVHPISEPTSTKQFTAPSPATASVLNLLASAQSGSLHGRTAARGKRDGGDKAKVLPPLSGPTLCLEKLNITGETTPPLHALGTPPTPTLLKRTISRSPPKPASENISPPASQSEKDVGAVSTPTPSTDRSDPFTGVFTPAYLPLLESRDRPSSVSSLPVATSQDAKERLQLNAEGQRHAELQRLESSQSLPPQPVSPTIVANKRTNSSPLLPSASLPSALRSVSGGRGRRKHVMFQLADLKVVDPSSSYEEGPSPELEARDELDDQDSHLSSEQDADLSRRIRGSPRIPSNKDRKSRRGKSGRFISPNPSPLASPMPSPALREASPVMPMPTSSFPQPVPGDSGFAGGLTGADDGGSGVGFFELDEELASPALKEDNPAESFDLELGDEISEKSGTVGDGLGIVPSLHVGSVPINIVKPSSSFVGSYGH
jgi:hypothetical protein